MPATVLEQGSQCAGQRKTELRAVDESLVPGEFSLRAQSATVKTLAFGLKSFYSFMKWKNRFQLLEEIFRLQSGGTELKWEEGRSLIDPVTSTCGYPGEHSGLDSVGQPAKEETINLGTFRRQSPLDFPDQKKRNSSIFLQGFLAQASDALSTHRCLTDSRSPPAPAQEDHPPAEK